MKRKVVIGIHGVANKPPKEVLEQWWLSAINEGLAWIEGGVDVTPAGFRLMYWADAMYVRPQTPDEHHRSPFRLTQPYAPSPYPPPAYEDTPARRMSRRIGKGVSDFLYARRITFGTLAKPIIAATMKDLDVFSDRTRRFQGTQTAGEFLMGRLETLLREQGDDSVLLIGHSLGSVIAYMTLQTFPDLAVDLLVTIGSPLMQLGFRKAWVEGQKEFHFADCEWPVVPPNIRAWKNFVDWKDPVLIKSPPALREYYLTRDGKQVIEDYLVRNGYTCTDGKGRTVSRPHNSYGYLRCPEVSRAIREFLATG